MPKDIQVPKPGLRGVGIPTDENGIPLLQTIKYDSTWGHVILEEENVEIFNEILAENNKAEILSVHNLKPKNKLLFFGPSGTGKTQTAKVLSSALNLPLVCVNLSCIFSSYLGQTVKNLTKIFDYISTDDYVVFFDEFDAIASSRDINGDSSEIRRLINSLLLLIDGVDRGLLIAATNNKELLDPAVWRRFDEVLMFAVPNAESRSLILNRYLLNIEHDLELSGFVNLLDGATGADIERVCTNAIKEAVLRGDSRLDEATLFKAISRFRKRAAMALV